MERSLTRSRVTILLGAILFSTAGTAIKSCDFSALQVAGLRSAIASLTIFLLMPSARTRGSWRTWLVGLAFAATMILFVVANKNTTAANSIFLQAASPIYILFLAPFLLKEPVRRGELGFLLILALGMAFFFVGTEPPVKTAPHPLLGNVLAALSGVTFALTLVGLRWVARAEGDGAGAASGAFLGNLIAFLVLIPWIFPVKGSSTDWLVVAFLGVFQIGLGYTLVAISLRGLPALEASLLMMVEPVLNPIWTFLFIGERPSRWSLGGGAIILTATALRTLRDLRPSGDPKKKAPREPGAPP